MALTRRQVTLTLSAIYLAALTVLAAFALHHSHVYSLPIPDIVCALALALPPLAGVALETVLSLDSHLARKGQVHASRIFQTTIAAFLIYETVVATLAGVYVSPFGGMQCALKDRWAALRSAKDADSIRKIQDAFNCCGLMSTKDMAWPFPEKAHPEADRCVVRFDRSQACIEPWRAEEQRVAVMLMIVPIAVFLWKASSPFCRFCIARNTHTTANAFLRFSSSLPPLPPRLGSLLLFVCRRKTPARLVVHGKPSATGTRMATKIVFVLKSTG
ncbi:hypothetical protein BTJ68_03704 [Hortaea werneckii EXF-2000]|uniref:Tetraspanin Tsp3 n=1 Tax=Hortaea werneckii EXF-2000 TaxID=1157616 RepID=A0A1Z5TKH9_HORWE|nr:hypothetical protein BTJ68_03704 [Hortaea werneckii EXF-2000]